MFGIDRRCKVQSPCVVGHWIFPINKAFRCLTNTCTCRRRRRKQERNGGFHVNSFPQIDYFSVLLFRSQFEIHITWLNESNVEYFIHLTVVRSNVEHAFRRILDTGDVDGNKIFGYLLPFNGASTTCRYMKHFGPQPEYTNEIKLVVMKQQKLCFTFKLVSFLDIVRIVFVFAHSLLLHSSVAHFMYVSVCVGSIGEQFNNLIF